MAASNAADCRWLPENEPFAGSLDRYAGGFCCFGGGASRIAGVARHERRSSGFVFDLPMSSVSWRFSPASRRITSTVYGLL